MQAVFVVFVVVVLQSWGFRKVQGFKVPLGPALLKACKFVGRPEVNNTLVYLDILDVNDLAELREEGQEEGPVMATMVFL